MSAGPDLNEQICFALYATTGTVTQAYAELLKPYGLTYPQFVIMMALWAEQGVSITQLSQRVGLSKATLTPLLKKMEMTGWLSRQDWPDNERKKRICLTEQGKTFAATAEDIARKAFCATGISVEEADTLIAICDKIRGHLQNR